MFCYCQVQQSARRWSTKFKREKRKRAPLEVRFRVVWSSPYLLLKNKKWRPPSSFNVILLLSIVPIESWKQPGVPRPPSFLFSFLLNLFSNYLRTAAATAAAPLTLLLREGHLPKLAYE